MQAASGSEIAKTQLELVRHIDEAKQIATKGLLAEQELIKRVTEESIKTFNQESKRERRKEIMGEQRKRDKSQIQPMMIVP